jgi:hypothetical protein
MLFLYITPGAPKLMACPERSRCAEPLSMKVEIDKMKVAECRVSS